MVRRREPWSSWTRPWTRTSDHRVRPAVCDLQALRDDLHGHGTARRLLSDADRPVQLVFAGKAHPADRPGQAVIQEIFGRTRSPEFRGKVFILEDYDMRIARFLVAGVDVWLNNPRRPLEASGTSGMKAATNGVVNLSVLDGWWDEGFSGDNGWAIGGREPLADEAAQDWADAMDLYRILESETVPEFYERDEAGISGPVGRAHAPVDRNDAVAVLDDADAPRVHGAAVPSRGGHRGRPGDQSATRHEPA